MTILQFGTLFLIWIFLEVLLILGVNLSKLQLWHTCSATSPHMDSPLSACVANAD